MIPNVNARALAIDELNKVKLAATRSGEMLAAARKANLDWATSKTAFNAGRRMVTAQEAYTSRMNLEAGRVRAAYALLAMSEQDAMTTASRTAAQVTDAQRKDVLVRTAKMHGLRLNAMVQAIKATDEALKNVPGLPGNLVGRAASSSQVNIGMSQTFRSPAQLELMGRFFPSDIRAAAGSFEGVGLQDCDEFATQCEKCMREDAANVASRAREYARRAANLDPSSAALAQKAEALADRLGTTEAAVSAASTNSVAVGPFRVPKVALGLGAAGFLVFLFTRS